MALCAIVVVECRAPPMHAFKTRTFARWADRNGVNDQALAAAAAEMERGLIDARLGGQVVKKRVALPDRGKRGGARTLVAFKRGEKAFFVYGFAKNERAQHRRQGTESLEAVGKGVNGLPGSIPCQGDQCR